MTPCRGEIRLVNLDPTIGDEIRKSRPAVVVSRDAIGTLALRVIVPITSWQDRFQGCDWLVKLDPDRVNNLDKPSAADTFQVRSVSALRFVRRLGKITKSDMNRIGKGLNLVLMV
jgi:mRNA interferase MazF